MIRVEYSHNNSGGSDWLERDDWDALLDHGWKVTWWGDGGPDDRGYMAEKVFESLDAGVTEWEKVTGQRAADNGCECCGPPHNFSGRDLETDRWEWWDGHDPYDEDDDF